MPTMYCIKLVLYKCTPISGDIISYHLILQFIYYSIELIFLKHWFLMYQCWDQTPNQNSKLLSFSSKALHQTSVFTVSYSFPVLFALVKGLLLLSVLQAFPAHRGLSSPTCLNLFYVVLPSDYTPSILIS